MDEERPEEEGPVIGPKTRPPTAVALPPGGRYITMGAHARIIKDHLKAAVGGSSTEQGGNLSPAKTFTIYSDEPSFMGGEGLHPQPLLYIAAGVAF
jgi:hypothetical protein